MTEAAARPQGRRLSIAHLALLLPWVALVIDSWDPIVDNSFLWHVRAGTVQADQASVLTSDPFSFTMPGERWLTQSWLAELLYGWAEGLTGLGFVPYMILVVGGLTFAGIGLIAYRHSKSVPATAFVMILSILALISFLVPRPVLFSYVLMTLLIVAWDRPKARWAVPFLLWIWASVHASFVIGLAYIGLSLIMKKDWRALPAAIIAGSATLVTAHGMGVVSFLLDFGESNDALQYLTEWRRPSLLDPVALPFLGSLVFIVMGAFRGRILPIHLWLILPFTLLGLTSVRAIPPAFVGLVPVLALSLSGLELGTKGRLRARLAIVFSLVVLTLPFFLISGSRLLEERFPLQAVSTLDASRTFHDDVVGGFLIWAVGPGHKVYIDDRAELYGERMGEFVRLRRGEIDWKPVFDRDGIEQALLKTDAQMTSELREAGWVTVHEDEHFIVLRTGS
jgi:hypothetical protein